MKILVPCSLALAIASGLAVAGPIYAATLNPGESATVNPGDPIESWTVRGAGAVLTFTPSSAATSVNTREGAALDMTGAVVSGSEPFASAFVTSASAKVTGSTISNDGAAALAVTNGNTSGVQPVRP